MKLAFVGLGAIGLPIARRLSLHPDISLSIFDTRAEVLEAEAGLGRVARSIGDAISDADVIFSVLPADAHLRAVAEELVAAATAGQLFVDFSTVAPSTMDAVASQLEEIGVETLGAALTRSVAAAETGDLSIFVGGSRELVERARPAFEQMATDIRVVATVGASKALKILNNMQVSSLDLAICDGLLVGAKHGLAPAELTALLRRRGADSWPLRNHIEKHLLADDLAPGRFSTRYMGKDATLAAELAFERGEPAWFTALVTSAYRGTEALGYGEHYHPVVMRWLEHAIDADPITAPAAASAELPEAAETIARGIVALQALISFDALRLAAGEGIPVSESLEHFDSGSASNDFVQAMLSGGRDAAADRRFGGLASDLRAVCGLAATVDAPATTFAVGTQIALSWQSRFGPEATAASVLE